MTTAAIYATREVSWRPSFYRGEQYDATSACIICAPDTTIRLPEGS